ncbi:HAF repeat-containing protein [Actinoplanes sp. N902-109]|uniref:HAF repeat-containing protein n=1 Tax=Actinoplanes sp. (strain N902-109) TaxID=649831 RepID=UPI0006851933|nr:HAF repeat-containing protein [Actinoplanes sp. N902-109]
MSDNGEVVGWSATAAGLTHPFRWAGGAMTDLGTLDQVDGGWGIATAVNRFGTVAGQSRRNGVARAVRRQHGVITDLGTLGGGTSFATAINDRGDIAGLVLDAGAAQAALWRHGRLQVIGHLPGGTASGTNDINDWGVVLGAGNVSSGSVEDHAFLWRRGVFRDLSGAEVPNGARSLDNGNAIIGVVPGPAAAPFRPDAGAGSPAAAPRGR